MPTQVLITGALHDKAISAFRANPNFDIQYYPDCARDELLKRVASAQVLVTRSETDVDRTVIDQARELKVIARAAVGVGNIDIDYATEKGILVVNCPGKNTNSAAELTLGLLLSVVRQVAKASNHMKKGGWDRHTFHGSELRGKSIGLVGLGNVGHRVAKFCYGFDMTVHAYDPYVAPQVFQRNNALQSNSLADLAAKVDILSVHVPLNKETRGMVDKDVLALLPQGAIVINAARGGVIDEHALLEAMLSGHVAGAGIDTWENEPKPLRALVDHERVVCTPHIGATTEEAQIAIGATVVEQVEKAVEGGVVDHPVNLPQFGVIDNPLLKPYAVLAEKLGSMVGQLLSFNPTSMEVSYRGDLAGMDHSIIRLSLMKGYAGHVVDGFVSFVNADSHFEKLGIELSEKEDPGFGSYKSALKLWVHGAGGELLTLGGIVFDNQYPRISLLNDFYFEVEPTGDIIVLENDDRPGVIGDVGHFLASHEINIDTFDLSRNKKGGRAMAMIRIDSTLTPLQVKAMRGIKNVRTVHAMRL